MCNVNYHPLDSELKAYVDAELSPSMSMMVCAHLDFCSDCRERTAKIEASNAETLAEIPQTALSDDLTSMLGNIMSLEPDKSNESVFVKATTNPIRINQREFDLPRILRGHDEQIGPWSKLPGNVHRAPIYTEAKSKMNLIYMSEDSMLPEHTHTGREITLVLAGQFVDESGTYGPGDFISQTDRHQHQPRTMSGQDCLCLTLLDAPLKFTSGVATLLNPFSQLFFR